MTQLRCTLGALLGLALAACGDNATIVSVNISYADDVEDPAKIHVQLSQGSQTPVNDTFDAPTNKAVVEEMTVDVVDRGYFKRYDLSGWADGEAKLKVELINAAGTVYLTEENIFDVEENGAAAAYAEFKIDPPEETGTDTGSSVSDSVSDSASDASSAPSSTASDASTSAAADSSTGDAQATDAATDASSTGEGGASDSGDAASSDDASTEDAAE